MKRKIIIAFSIITLSLTSILLVGFTTQKKFSIDGNWLVAEVQTIKPDGSFTKVYPKESMVLFNRNVYSFCWTSNSTNMRNWAMTDSAKLNRFNQSIVNSGTFELKEDVLTTKAAFAMNPMFVNGLATFKCSYNNDTLILTGVNVMSSENIPHPVYAGGSHIVTKLVRKKDL